MKKSQREGHISGRNDRCKGPEVAQCSELHCNTVATGHWEFWECPKKSGVHCAWAEGEESREVNSMQNT